MYKIKGKGDRRDVMDGDRLVGRIVKHEYKSESATFGPRGMERFSSVLKSEWFGEHLDGTEVRNIGAIRRVRYDAMKTWTKPDAWVTK